MKLVKNFAEGDGMVDLINYDYTLLPLLSRFGLPLGFGLKTIAETCRDAGVDVNLFLLIINYITTGNLDSRRMGSVGADGVVDFLHNSHEYFISYKFPHIRQNLLNALDDSHREINPGIIKFYDDFVASVSRHFNYEERTLFPYVRGLAAGRLARYNIGIFTRQHDEVADILSELKNIILRFYTTSLPNKMYDALVDIYNCEEDLDAHSDIENNILVPIVAQIEKRLSGNETV